MFLSFPSFTFQYREPRCCFPKLTWNKYLRCTGFLLLNVRKLSNKQCVNVSDTLSVFSIRLEVKLCAIWIKYLSGIHTRFSDHFQSDFCFNERTFQQRFEWFSAELYVIFLHKTEKSEKIVKKYIFAPSFWRKKKGEKFPKCTQNWIKKNLRMW